MILRLKICTSVDRNVRVERPGSRTRIGTGSFASALAEQLAALFDEVDEYELAKVLGVGEERPTAVDLGEPLDVTSIAAHARLSVRALQEGFRATFGTTPMRYVRQARLRQARDDLRCATGDEGVTQIAHRWGFTHLGRFACLYRQTFGESPSAALNTGVRRYGTRSPIHATDECADATLS